MASLKQASRRLYTAPPVEGEYGLANQACCVPKGLRAGTCREHVDQLRRAWNTEDLRVYGYVAQPN